jgi:hypothetical protein
MKKVFQNINPSERQAWKEPLVITSLGSFVFDLGYMFPDLSSDRSTEGKSG